MAHIFEAIAFFPPLNIWKSKPFRFCFEVTPSLQSLYRQECSDAIYYLIFLRIQQQPRLFLTSTKSLLSPNHCSILSIFEMAQECHPVAVWSHLRAPCAEHDLMLPHNSSTHCSAQLPHSGPLPCYILSLTEELKGFSFKDTKLQAFSFHPGWHSPKPPQLERHSTFLVGILYILLSLANVMLQPAKKCSLSGRQH